MGSAEVKVKQGFKPTEQIGIAVACLIEEENKLLIDWVVDVSPSFVNRIYIAENAQLLKRVGRQRQDIVEATDAVEEPGSDEDEETAAARQVALVRRIPSKEAMDKFEDYRESAFNDDGDII